MQSKTIAIIGGNGFIGVNLVAKFAERGVRVRCIGRQERMDILDSSADYYRLQSGNVDELVQAMEGCTEVVDLAYASVPKTSFSDPIMDIQENLPRTLNLFNAVSRIGARKLILLSSGGAIYGKVRNLPIQESDLASPISPYGITKLAIEKYAGLYFEIQKLPVICLRPGNVYGRWQKPFRGQGFVATAMASLYKSQQISIYGRVSAIRDYVHVDDMSNAILAALDHGIPGLVYNVGTGKGRDLYQILDAIEVAAGRKFQDGMIQVLPERPFDVPVNILDSSLINSHTGWCPTVSLADGMSEAWNHMKNFPSFYGLE